MPAPEIASREDGVAVGAQDTPRLCQEEAGARQVLDDLISVDNVEEVVSVGQGVVQVGLGDDDATVAGLSDALIDALDAVGLGNAGAVGQTDGEFTVAATAVQQSAVGTGLDEL